MHLLEGALASALRDEAQRKSPLVEEPLGPATDKVGTFAKIELLTVLSREGRQGL
jgi:hypothetical protein